MHAFATTANKNLDQAFECIPIEIPPLQPFQACVKVLAISINPVDTKLRKTVVPGTILGWDAAGTIVDLGDEAKNLGFQIGDAVYYAGEISQPGCNAQYQSVDVRLMAKSPSNLTLEESAAVPLTGITAWEALFECLPLKRYFEVNQSTQMPSNIPKILIINGAGGVGSMAIQLLKALTPLTIIATASRPLSTQWCLDLGADYVVDHHDLINNLASIGITEVDYIFNCYDIGVHWKNMINLIRPFGHIVAIAETQIPLNLNELQRKSVTFSWEFMFSKKIYNHRFASQGEILARLTQLLEEKRIRSNLSEILGPLTLENLIKTHRLLESGHVTGKLVLVVDHDPD